MTKLNEFNESILGKCVLVNEVLLDGSGVEAVVHDALHLRTRSELVADALVEVLLKHEEVRLVFVVMVAEMFILWRCSINSSLLDVEDLAGLAAVLHLSKFETTEAVRVQHVVGLDYHTGLLRIQLRANT